MGLLPNYLIFQNYACQVQPLPGLDVIGSPKAMGCTHGYCCSGPTGLGCASKIILGRQGNLR